MHTHGMWYGGQSGQKLMIVCLYMERQSGQKLMFLCVIV